MSQRPKRNANPAATSGAQSVSSAASTASTTSSRSEIPESPLSPSRRSRLHEKNSLMNLNDRLACYIERVRFLEQENSRLSMEMNAYQDTAKREAESLKAIYEGELTDARKLLDETARERARVEIDAKRYWEENDQLRMKLNKKTKELSELEKEARTSEARCVELTANYNSVCSERKKLQDELREADKEASKLRKTFENMRKDLENETLVRVDLENNIQSLREELTFKEQVHSQQLAESKVRRQTEISEIDGFLMEQYETKLQQTLQELREQYDAQLRMNRDEISELYDARIRSLESRLTDERIQHDEERQKLEKEIGRMRDQMSVQIKEYQDLMDIKISLDMEIAAYDKLLSSEETRLNITPSINSTSATATALSTSSRLFCTPSLKRKRNVLDDSLDYSITSSAKGDLEIAECDPDGKFIKLRNKSKKSEKLEEFQLIRRTEHSDTVYKFSKGVKIEGSTTITIWSDSAGKKADSPSCAVMKGQSWATGDNMITVLLNAEGQEVAHVERVKMKAANVSGHKDKYFIEESGTRLGVNASSVKPSKNERSAVEGTKTDEQCAIM
ncbi:lamin Dm0-like [Toxorhynchites rutilus septentrionalis]|uniref:lamin Dm0-like n=1 Tax=Toxorhynchites rutilus septentrionalis TaxID=329112 RepID=UPI002479D4AD|nr:lamin Dm0-like [Toxorhynchites rutilus septentrionalis]